MNRGVFIDRQRKGVGVREDGIFAFLAHASVFQNNEKKNKTTSVYRLHYRNHTEITVVMCSSAEAISGMVSVPAPNLSGVVWTPIRITPKIVTILMCEYPGCQRLFMRGFRFQSVLKSDLREKLRRSWLRPSADKTKLPVAHEKQPLVPGVMCERKPRSGKWRVKRRKIKWKV